MDAERPEKAVLRGLWADEFAEVKLQQDDAPLYMGLTGAQARDLRTFVERGLLDLAPSGQALAAEYLGMEVVRTPLDAERRSDIGALRSAIEIGCGAAIRWQPGSSSRKTISRQHS